VFLAAFVEEPVFSPLCVVGSFVEVKFVIDAWASVLKFYLA
jgi:hypothetical protein